MLRHILNKGGPNINSTALFQLLNLKIEDVKEIKLPVVTGNQIDVDIELHHKVTCCPHCSSFNIESKGRGTRHILDKPFTEKKTYVHEHFRKYRCLECGKTFEDSSVVALKGMKVSIRIVKMILEDLKSPNETFDSIGKRYDISNTTVANIFDKCIVFHEKKLTRVICIDEIYVRPHSTPPYACIILDPIGKKLLAVRNGREKNKLRNYFLERKPAERALVEYVCIDMWEPYLVTAQAVFPNATVAIDSFHVMKHFMDAVDDIRCRLMRKYDEKSIQYYLLKSVRELLTLSRELKHEKQKNFKFKQMLSEYDLVQMACDSFHELNVAYNFYHAYQRFNAKATVNTCNEHFDKVFEDVTEIIAIPELKDLVLMVQHWKPYILNSFIRIDEMRLSNGPIEGTNKTLKKIRKTIGKVDNFKRFARRCYLVINKEINLSNSFKNDIKRKRQPRGSYNTKKPEE